MSMIKYMKITDRYENIFLYQPLVNEDNSLFPIIQEVSALSTMLFILGSESNIQELRKEIDCLSVTPASNDGNP